MCPRPRGSTSRLIWIWVYGAFFVHKALLGVVLKGKLKDPSPPPPLIWRALDPSKPGLCQHILVVLARGALLRGRLRGPVREALHDGDEAVQADEPCKPRGSFRGGSRGGVLGYLDGRVKHQKPETRPFDWVFCCFFFCPGDPFQLGWGNQPFCGSPNFDAYPIERVYKALTGVTNHLPTPADEAPHVSRTQIGNIQTWGLLVPRNWLKGTGECERCCFTTHQQNVTKT